MLTDFNFAKIWKHPDRPPLAAFACSTVSRLRVKTQLVRTDHIYTTCCSVSGRAYHSVDDLEQSSCRSFILTLLLFSFFFITACQQIISSSFMGLYVHRNHKANYQGLGAQGVHLDFHTAPELWESLLQVQLYIQSVKLT